MNFFLTFYKSFWSLSCVWFFYKLHYLLEHQNIHITIENNKSTSLTAKWLEATLSISLITFQTISDLPCMMCPYFCHSHRTVSRASGIFCATFRASMFRKSSHWSFIAYATHTAGHLFAVVPQLKSAYTLSPKIFSA